MTTNILWPHSYKSEAGFLNDLRETLTYGELFRHYFYLIPRTFGREGYSNNSRRCLYNRARCILIDNFLELGKTCVSKAHRKLRSPVPRSRIRPQGSKADP